MGVSPVHFSSQSVHWATPRAVYDALDAEFRFDHDPCPLHSDTDGVSPLFSQWDGKRVYCNPPYGKPITQWLMKHREADLAVYLLPARTDTKWFHEIVLKEALEIRFLRGRLKFGDAVNSAPFPSMIVVFRKAKVSPMTGQQGGKDE